MNFVSAEWLLYDCFFVYEVKLYYRSRPSNCGAHGSNLDKDYIKNIITIKIIIIINVYIIIYIFPSSFEYLMTTVVSFIHVIYTHICIILFLSRQ